MRLTWRKHLCDLIRGQARSWSKGERLGGRRKHYFAHYLLQESFRIHQEAACYEPKEFGSVAMCYWQGSDHQLLLRAANMDNSSPCPEKLSGALSPPWGCSFLEREGKQQPAQQKPADRTNKAKGTAAGFGSSLFSTAGTQNLNIFSIECIPSSTALTYCLSLDPQLHLDSLFPGLEEVLAGRISNPNILEKRYQICIAVRSKGP